MLDVATKPDSKLSIISILFEALHENSIFYCHWKSNEHLSPSMQGLTDLDVLFAESQKEKIESILHQLGFKRFNAISQKVYKDIVDFLILDPGSGRLIHLHTHFRLTMGEPYLKSYQFSSNIEMKVLAEREYNEEYGLFCIKPAFELVLLFFRESLRLRHRDYFRMGRLNEHILREFRWLKSRVSNKDIEQVIETCFNSSAAIYQIVNGDFNQEQLWRLSSIIKNENHVSQLYSPPSALFRRWYREASVIFSKKISTVFDHPILFKRINPRGGKIIALIGADGSGKSTISQSLKSTFEPKLDVYKIYFGRGDGKSSPSRRLLNGGRFLLKIGTKKSATTVDQQEARKKHGLLTDTYRCLNALLVAREKSRNLKLMKIAQGKGALVICDRYPQNQIMGYNDGPLLDGFLNSRNPVLRALAKIEGSVYAKAETHPPDLLLKLVADAAEVQKRKPDETTQEKLEMKIQGIKSLRFMAPAKVITVDASKPLNEVLFLIRTEIWKVL